VYSISTATQILIFLVLHSFSMALSETHYSNALYLKGRKMLS
jgi:hypothetical protein